MPILQERVLQNSDDDRIRRGQGRLSALRQRRRGAALGSVLRHYFQEERLKGYIGSVARSDAEARPSFSRPLFRVLPGPTLPGLRRSRMCFAETRAGLPLARKTDGPRRTSEGTHASVDDKTHWQGGLGFPQSPAAPVTRRYRMLRP